MRTTARVLSLLLSLVMCLSLAPAAGAAESGFPDVQPGVWYYDDVMACAGLGITPSYNQADIKNGDFKACMNQNGYGALDVLYACGGWACMVSNTIFGNTGFPARQVTEVNKLRPGDIIISLANGKPSHVSIVCKTGTYLDKPAYNTCDGNIFGIGNQYGAVSWPTQYSAMTRTLNGFLAFTRYPEGVAE